MSEPARFEGLALGGPMDGRRIAHTGPLYRVLRPLPPPAATVAMLAPWEQVLADTLAYDWHPLGYASDGAERVRFGFWLPSPAPADPGRVIIETLIAGYRGRPETTRTAAFPEGVPRASWD